MLLATTLLALAVSGPGATTGGSGHDADTVEIVTLVLKDFLGARGEAPEGSYLVVVAETLVICPPDGEQGDPFSVAAAIREPDLDVEVPQSMRRSLLCDQEVGMLPAANLENARVVLSSEIDAIFTGDGWWDEFYKTFPGSRGFLQFSAIAYSDAGKQAFLYVSHSCGGLCGTGWIVSLSLRGERWQVTSKRMLWIS